MPNVVRQFSSSQPSGSHTKKPVFKPLRRSSLHSNSLLNFKAQKPSPSSSSAARLAKAPRFFIPPSSARIEKVNDPPREREPREIFRDPDATLNETIGALAKTQWTRLDKMDALAADFEGVDKKLDKMLSKVRSVEEAMEESTKTTLDAMHTLREECMSASMGKKMYSTLKQVCEQSWAIFEQKKSLQNQQEANGGEEMLAKLEKVTQQSQIMLDENLKRRRETELTEKMLQDLSEQSRLIMEQNEALRKQREEDLAIIREMASRLEQVEQEMKPKPVIAAPVVNNDFEHQQHETEPEQVEVSLLGQLEKEIKVAKALTIHPPRKPRRSGRQRRLTSRLSS